MCCVASTRVARDFTYGEFAEPRGKCGPHRLQRRLPSRARPCGALSDPLAPLAKADGNVASCRPDLAFPGDDMTLVRRFVFALPLALLIAAPADGAPKRHPKTGAGQGSWDGRWVGAWGGSRPTVQIVKDGKLVAYEFDGQTFPVATSRVTSTEIVYGEDVVVTLTRTGPNTAHATIKTSQGSGTAELTRQ